MENVKNVNPILCTQFYHCGFKFVHYSQFEQTETPYYIIKKWLQNCWENIKKGTQRVHHTTTFKEVTEKLMSINGNIYHTGIKFQMTYTIDHKFSAQWKFSAFKYEPQSSHLNKKEYSLHCMVKHEGDKNHYLYQLSDELTHNFAFTFNVSNTLFKWVNNLHNFYA